MNEIVWKFCERWAMTCNFPSRNYKCSPTKNALHEASRNLLQKNKKEAKQNGMYALEISKPFHICTIS